jgi:hypothetical protein
VKKTNMAMAVERGDMKGQTESELTATHNQALQTIHHATKILQTETVSHCSLSKKI